MEPERKPERQEIREWPESQAHPELQEHRGEPAGQAFLCGWEASARHGRLLRPFHPFPDASEQRACR